jgi:hypothetical protein
MFSFKHTTFASMIKILILYFLSILSLHAQDHLNSWSRITFLKNFSKSFNTSIEFQHRRQNNFASDNPFDKNLMNSFRIWNTISLSKKTNISISPFAVFRNFTIIESIDESKKSAITEYRFAGTFDVSIPISKKWSLSNRAGIEYRVYDIANPNQIRIRNRIGIKYQWHDSKQQIYIFEEPFITLKGYMDSQHIYDHNRIGALYINQLTENIKLEAGYIYIDRLIRNHTESIDESNFILNLTLQI